MIQESGLFILVLDLARLGRIEKNIKLSLADVEIPYLCKRYKRSGSGEPAKSALKTMCMECLVMSTRGLRLAHTGGCSPGATFSSPKGGTA